MLHITALFEPQDVLNQVIDGTKVSIMKMLAPPNVPNAVPQCVSLHHLEQLSVKAKLFLVSGWLNPSKDPDSHTMVVTTIKPIQVTPNWPGNPWSQVPGLESYGDAIISGVNVGGSAAIQYKAQHKPGGKPVLNFSVPIADMNQLLSGESPVTSWVRCALWNDRAKTKSDLQQGQRIQTMSGQLSFQSYQTKEGVEQVSTEFLVNTILWGKPIDGVTDENAPAPEVTDDQDLPVSAQEPEPVPVETNGHATTDVAYDDVPVVAS
jgi:single-stranded DNA-binding protein